MITEKRISDEKKSLGFVVLLYTTDKEAEPEAEGVIVMCLRLRRLSVVETLRRPMVFGPSDKVILGEELSSFRSGFSGIRYATCITETESRERDVSGLGNWKRERVRIRALIRVPERMPLRRASRVSEFGFCSEAYRGRRRSKTQRFGGPYKSSLDLL